MVEYFEDTSDIPPETSSTQTPITTTHTSGKVTSCRCSCSCYFLLQLMYSYTVTLQIKYLLKYLFFLIHLCLKSNKTIQM